MLQPRDLKGRIAISYARWSSGRQAKGDSLRRQTENAEKFCATYGLTLDYQLVDDGVSAFKGANLEASLGQFVADIKDGKISNETVLIVENIDRITRVKPTRAVRYFLDLLDTGITLVTLTDERVHTAEGYDDNFANLMMSLMAMQAAHEYSAKISYRVGDAWNKRANLARQGKVKISKVPFWIDRESQELNHRADDARLIFRLAEEGLGQTAIVRHLNENGIPSATGGKWEKSMVQATLASRAAYGSYVVKGDEVRDYFPAIVSEARWLALRDRNRDRMRNPQASNTANLFPRLLRCHHCGHPMNLSTTKHRGKHFRYLTCSGKAFKQTDCTAPNWRYETFEAEFLDRIGFLAIPIPQAGGNPEASQQAALQDDIAVLVHRRANLMDAIADAETQENRKVLVAKADEVSRDIEAKQAELIRLRESAARYQSVVDTVDDFVTDQEEIRRLASADRPTAKRLIGDLVAGITLESDSKELRAAHVTMRHRGQYTIVFDETGME